MTSKKTGKVFIGVGALAIVSAAGTLYLRHLHAEPSDAKLGSAAGVAPAPVPAASANSSRPRSPVRKARTAQQPNAADSPERAKANRERVENWLTNARSYTADDRAAVLDTAMTALLAGGAESVFEIENQLAEISVYEQAERAAAFHALGRLGKDLVGSNDPKAKKALEAIQRMAKAELELPSLIEPNPEVDVEALPKAARDELLHQGILVEEDGVLWQPTTLNKLPVVRMLRTIGGKESLATLKRLADAKDNPVGVKFAVQQAIEVASK